MRRFALTLAASTCALLAACSSGSGLSTGNTDGTIDGVVFTNGSAQVNDFFLAPGPTPLLVSAEGVSGSGAFTQIDYGAAFTWGATYAAAGTPYVSGSSPNGNKVCGAPSSVTAAIPLWLDPSATTPLGGGRATQTVFVGAPSGVTPAAPATNYCIDVVATHAGSDGRQGSVLVVVSSSP